MSELVLPRVRVTEVPIATGGLFPARRVYCAGRNNLDHIREMKEADERDPPFFFQKPRDAVVVDGARVPYPPAGVGPVVSGDVITAHIDGLPPLEIAIVPPSATPRA